VSHVVELASGTLFLDVTRAELPLEALCGFADRHSSRRSFLFVSKVLGKHVPVRPSRMAEIHALIAEGIAPTLPGPVAFVALAETAIGLGQSVYEAYRERTGREDTMFLHSTRYAVGTGERLAFSEAHSHAPSHLLHLPPEARTRANFEHARSLVLVDDEISTGNTLTNAVLAIRSRAGALSSVTCACITDWSGQSPSLAARVGLPVSFVSALEGSFRFEQKLGAPSPPAPRVEATEFEAKDAVLSGNFGRQGILDLPPLRGLPALSPVPQRVLVLGTGEFLYLPFKLAQALEAAGHEVEFQSTTRSPVHLGGAIGHRLVLVDNYFDGMPNFLYNAQPGAHDVVIACYETPRLPPEHDLPARLGARLWVPT